MLRFVSRLLWVELVALLLLAGPASLPVFAQGKDKEKAKEKDKSEPASFETIDGVQLKGLYYPSPKRQAAPGTVLMLHHIGTGESSQKKDWKELAEALNKKDFAVLMFDFRGHGQSTEIDPVKFWDPLQVSRFNIQLVKGSTANPPRTAIKLADFPKNYYGAFINDIAAAKAYLDRKNDNRDCNTSNLILIGAQEGATLGATWMRSEHNRYRVTEEIIGIARLEKPERTSEGRDVICAVWLSISSRLGERQLVLPERILYQAGKAKATPMLFLYGDKDDGGKALAKKCETSIKSAKEKEKYAFTGAYAVKDTNLKGIGLLTAAETKKEIADYLLNVTSEKTNEWYLRDYKKTKFVWVTPGWVLPITPISPFDYNRLYFLAKPTSDMQLIFDTYERFLR